MSSHAPVVVRKGGFLSSLILGLSGTIAVIVICGAAVVIYGMNLMDRKFDQVVQLTPEMLHTLEDWQSFLPPMLADALDDRRDPAYRGQVEVSVDFLGDGEHRGMAPVLNIDNTGPETVSLLGVRIVLENDAGTPLRDWVEYPVTPIALEHDWPGPLLAGSERRVRLHSPSFVRDARHVRVEIVELRTWIDPGGSAEHGSRLQRRPIPLGQPPARDPSAADPGVLKADDAVAVGTDAGPEPADREAAPPEPDAGDQPEFEKPAQPDAATPSPEPSAPKASAPEVSSSEASAPDAPAGEQDQPK